MLTALPLSFAAPWLLLALAGLPALWWLLRVVPPLPRQLVFPPVRLLLALEPTGETPDRTPWWLLLLRTLVALLLIVGLAGPLWGSGLTLPGPGPLVLVLDNGWAAAGAWDRRLAAARDFVAVAERDGKPVLVQVTAPAGRAGAVPSGETMSPADARRRLQGLQPRPWPVDRLAALTALENNGALRQAEGTATVVWISDGLDQGQGATFMDRLNRFGPLTVARSDTAPVMLSGTENTPRGFAVTARRFAAAPFGASSSGASPFGASSSGALPAAKYTVVALREDGRRIATAPLVFPAGAGSARATFVVAADLRNAIARLVVAGETGAGATWLPDETFRRRRVGLAAAARAATSHPLLGDLYYLERALRPFADVRDIAAVDPDMRRLSVLFMADTGKLADATAARLAGWVADGGMLVRFAGPGLVESGHRLLPVTLRRGGRRLDGAMTWDRPARLAAFDADSPFAGLAVPQEVTVARQVLAEPGADLTGRVWARLEDGTPLVTGVREGQGWLVLFHTTANAAWSNLALSGLYVDMLRRLVAMSHGAGAAGAPSDPVPAWRLLDGFGQPGKPGASGLVATPAMLRDPVIGPDLPPGHYGTATSRVAVNLGADKTRYTALDPPGDVTVRSLAPDRSLDLRGWWLGLAMLLFLVDFAVSLWLRGLLRRRRPVAAAPTVAGLVIGLLLLAVLLPRDRAWGTESGDRFALESTLQTRLAYVLTADPAVNDISRQGLEGLGRILQLRTSVEPGAPAGVDPATDELGFFPLLYWPVTDSVPAPAADTVRRLGVYLRHGGTILFDTRDRHQAAGGAGPRAPALRRLLGGLEVPPLVPVPPDHVLTRAFYLLQDFPGRWAGGPLWIQRADMRTNDGVSPVVIGSNDYAAAWATGPAGQPVFPVVPGGARQREQAFRFGVNLVMYALAGSYKADQVHVPAILERLGQ